MYYYHYFDCAGGWGGVQHNAGTGPGQPPGQTVQWRGGGGLAVYRLQEGHVALYESIKLCIVKFISTLSK